VEIERRAKMHAALGDPVRLGLVDRLALSDLSPSELGEVAGLRSNLLAHHLGVLEEAGIIGRQQSQGDRRRSYVRLRLDDPAVRALVPDLGRPKGVRARRVVFVCTQNSARSKLAAAAWGRASEIPATSAGTHPAERVHLRAERTALKHQLRLTPGTSLFDDVVRSGDLVVSVCDQAHEELSAWANQPALHWSVPDPVLRDTDPAFERAFTEIASRVRTLAGALTVRTRR
jgi:ArsR family transcriptional regulator, arsenate/arsenite/antimonite-responsive transcriptional repressor / arsenate reductase (thioredoxin)